MVAKGDHDISTEHCGHRSLRSPPSLSIVLSSHVFLELDFAGGKNDLTILRFLAFNEP
jgi:hypothetical protein